jgi:hypothetical protein
VKSPVFVNNALESQRVNLLIVVEETFEFQDGTLHLVPAVPFEVADRARLRQGDQLELRRPDGAIISTKLYSFDWGVPSHGKIGLGLNKPITKTDIPAGTEVWKVG